ncbi:MAG: MarR family winged helix-turn-helix transcriptional regulator [Bacteroidales bacterium]|nr:MarR family winged helix-turn-helix transcriptional regulator [Bacteroidales bacterium]
MNYDFDKSIGKLTQQVSKKIGKNLEKRFEENGISLKAADWSIISMLYKHGKRNQRDISDFMAFDKVRIKRIIDRLENNKLVIREESETDKRFNNIKLTAQGKKMYKQLVKFAEEVISTATNSIPDTDINKCLDVLELIKENLILEDK